MLNRNLGIGLVVLGLANASCTFVAKFDGRESLQGGVGGGAGSPAGSTGANRGGAVSKGGGGGGAAGAGNLVNGGTPSAGQSSGMGSSASGGAIPSSGGASIGGSAGSSAVAGGGVAFGGAVSTGATAGSPASTVGGVAPIGGVSSGAAAAAFASTVGGAASVGGAKAQGGISNGGDASAVAGTTTIGPAAGSSGEAFGGCSGTTGATMVRTPLGYCIDSTEVTRSQYGMWLASTNAATLSAQDATTCGWNDAFAPDSTCMQGISYCDAAGCSYSVCHDNEESCRNRPQVCVDWCDASAYCRSVGKRLCGKIGGGPTGFSDYAMATASQWYAACSSDGKLGFPYDSSYGIGFCNYNNRLSPVDVASLSSCQAPPPYAGVYDMSGNVAEWEDSCDNTAKGATANCRLRGGSFVADTIYYPICSLDVSVARNTYRDTIGFRCCSL